MQRLAMPPRNLPLPACEEIVSGPFLDKSDEDADEDAEPGLNGGQPTPANRNPQEIQSGMVRMPTMLVLAMTRMAALGSPP